MQESGLTEVISLICISATQGQNPVFSLPKFPQVWTEGGNIPFLNPLVKKLKATRLWSLESGTCDTVTFFRDRDTDSKP